MEKKSKRLARRKMKKEWRPRSKPTNTMRPQISLKVKALNRRGKKAIWI
jgi:hypothetical protein